MGFVLQQIIGGFFTGRKCMDSRVEWIGRKNS